MEFSKEARVEDTESFRWRQVGAFRGACSSSFGSSLRKGDLLNGFHRWRCVEDQDGGIYWENISDGYFPRASVGSITVSQTHPNVVYV
jgi:hypothetical protein